MLVLALATPLFSPFFRRVSVDDTRRDDDEKKKTLPPVSIVLTDHDSSYHLAKVLPKLLEQKYSADFQVVVVIDRSDSDSEDVLKTARTNAFTTQCCQTRRAISAGRSWE